VVRRSRRARVLGDPVVARIAEATGSTPGTGGAALAHPARRHRVPEIGNPATTQGQLRAVRLRTHRIRCRRAVSTEQGRVGSHGSETRTTSTTSRTDQHPRDSGGDLSGRGPLGRSAVLPRPLSRRGDRGLQPAPTSAIRIDDEEVRLEFGEHPLASGLRGIVLRCR